MSRLVGYARTSTDEQKASFEEQIRDLKAVGCDVVFSEEVSSVKDRDQLDEALATLKAGDKLVVTKLDRLVRSVSQLWKIVEALEAKGVGLRILNFHGESVDTKSAMGRLILTMFAGFAQFEREQLIERQKVGIAKAKAEGKYKGRKPSVSLQADKMRAMAEAGRAPAAIAAQLNIGLSSVYRALKTV